MLQKCAKCGNTCQRIFVRKDRWQKNVFSDENGHLWMGTRCPSCKRDYHRSYNHARGTVSIDETKYHAIKSGREAERAVAAVFEALGWSVTLTTVKGPDIVAIKNGRTITVEVKRAKHAKKRDCWMSYPVSPKRRADDYCAIYFPDFDKIWVDSMPAHLAAASESGYRQVTKLRKELALCVGRVFLPPCLRERAFTS